MKISFLLVVGLQDEQHIFSVGGNTNGEREFAANHELRTINQTEEVKNMTKKLMPWLFLLSFLLLTSVALAGEKPLTGPGAVPSKCNCLKKDIAPPSPGLKADLLVGKPSDGTEVLKGPGCPPGYRYVCHWSNGHYYCWCQPPYYYNEL